MSNSNFKPNEIVIFSVKLPDIKNIKSDNVSSSIFTVKSYENTGKEATSYWRVYCNFRGEFK